MQKVLSLVTKDSSHCTRGASLASASFEVAAAPFNCSPPRPSTPGISRSITYFFMTSPFRLKWSACGAGAARGGVCRVVLDACGDLRLGAEGRHPAALVDK